MSQTITLKVCDKQPKISLKTCSDNSYFSGDYNDLTNKPTTISVQQAADIETNNAKVSFPEAPQDGRLYARKNGKWVEITCCEEVNALQTEEGLDLETEDGETIIY